MPPTGHLFFSAGMTPYPGFFENSTQPWIPGDHDKRDCPGHTRHFDHDQGRKIFWEKYFLIFVLTKKQVG
jgi:hypothetical protein